MFTVDRRRVRFRWVRKECYAELLLSFDVAIHTLEMAWELDCHDPEKTTFNWVVRRMEIDDSGVWFSLEGIVDFDEPTLH